MRQNHFGVWIVFVLVVLLAMLTGCNRGGAPPQPAAPPEPAAPPMAPNKTDAPPTGPKDAARLVPVTIYFGDSQAMYLLPVRREVPADRQAAGIVEALIAGPAANEPEARPIFPPGTRLLGITVADGVATVNFSRELQENFGGGSAAELLLAYAVANSLAGVDGIQAVQFAVEGRPLETLGHMDFTQPLKPRSDLIFAP